MRATPLSAAEAQLRNETQGLPVEEILALCYAFQGKPERLRLYLDILRGKSGERAQFASCLVCFDLGRQGDLAAQRDFTFLTTIMASLSNNGALVESLLGGDDYLHFVWELCTAQLETIDDRFEVGHDAAENQSTDDELMIIELLTDDDFDDDAFDINVDLSQLEAEYRAAVDEFLGARSDMPVFDPKAGFHMRSRRDTQRVNKFVNTLDSMREPLPLSRGLRALSCLYFGTHMRSKTFFGSHNPRKQQLLKDGLREFIHSPEAVINIVGIFGPMHADPSAWPKIADVMLDFVHQFSRSAPGTHALTALESYAAVERQAARDKQRGGRRRLRR